MIFLKHKNHAISSSWFRKDNLLSDSWIIHNRTLSFIWFKICEFSQNLQLTTITIFLVCQIETVFSLYQSVLVNQMRDSKNWERIWCSSIGGSKPVRNSTTNLTVSHILSVKYIVKSLIMHAICVHFDIHQYRMKGYIFMQHCTYSRWAALKLWLQTIRKWLCNVAF